jgi:hypothetical protein
MVRGLEPIVLPPPVAYRLTVPRNLFHIARDEGSIAPALRANIDALVAKNPCWQQRIFYDAEASDWVRATFPGRVSDAFHRIAPEYGVCRADFLRYMLIWHFGGVYLDLKSGVRHALDQMIRPDDQFLLSRLKNGRKWSELKDLTLGEEIQQWFIAARPGHPFLAAAIERVTANIETYRPLEHALGARAVIKLTGPIAFTQAIAPLFAADPHREIDSSAEGWLYTVLDDGTAHRGLNPSGHYGLKTGLHVLPPATGLLRWRAEALVFHAINLVRRLVRPLNHWRLERRKQRKALSH